MLVLRRRPHEALVFDGGLTLTLLSVVDRQAWIGLASPDITDGVAVGVLGVTATSLCLGVRSPREITRADGVITIALGEAEDDSVLLLNAAPGQVVVFDGIRLTVSSIEDGRALIGIATPSLPAPIGISIVSVSVAEARIGVDAPDAIRVYREEVWLEMQAANRGAAGEWSADDLAALTGDRLVRSDDDRR